MFTGPGLRTPRAAPSAQVETGPLLESDVTASDLMPPAFSYEPVQAMEAAKLKVEKKTVRKKANGYEKSSHGRSSVAPTSVGSELPSTISLGEELLPSAPERGSSRKTLYLHQVGAVDLSLPASGVAAGAEVNRRGLADFAGEAIDEESRRLIAKSWRELKEHEERCKTGQKTKQAEEDNGAASEGPGSAEGPQAVSKKSSGFWSNMSFGRKHHEGESSSSMSNEKGKTKDKQSNSMTLDIPQTFKEMCFLNAGMTGANMKYIEVVESCFENLVAATSSGEFVRLEVESNIMALRMHKDVQGKLNLNEFKTCMLASLRSLLPKSWSIAHEQAWSKMWEIIQNILTNTLPLPGKYEKAVQTAVGDMSEEDKRKYGLNAFNRFFAKQPKAEDHFNTSNARLSVLAMHGLELAQDIYREPTRLVNVVTSLGLKHIMYNISTEYFDSFVEAMVEELECWVTNPAAVQGVEWALTQIAAIMIYTIREGWNPLLEAVLTNNAKKVRSALAPLAKKDRAAMCLGALGHVLGKTDGDSRK